MSVKSGETSENIGAAPGATEPLAAPGFSSTTRGGPVPLFSMMNALGVGQQITPEIESYIKTIKECFQKDTNNLPTGNIVVRRLNEPAGAHAFLSGDAAIILLFDELLPHDMQKFTPVSDYGFPAFRSLQNDVPGKTRLLHVIVVGKEDYVRAPQMANYLQLNLAVANNTASSGDANISLFNNLQYTIDPNADTARGFIQQHSPHTVQPRIDIGFTIYAKLPRRDGSNLQDMQESRAIAAVGAYVEIWQPENQNYQTGNIKYAATVHITNITSLIPLPGILPLTMAIAADQFIQQNRWLQPFMSFQKGKPNLGNLSPDPQDAKKNWFAPNPQALYQWIGANMYTRPFLAVDVAEGVARIPALANYGDVEYTREVYNQIASFFGNVSLNRDLPPVIIMAQTFCGVYGDSRMPGQLVDSRDLDYMTMLAENKQDGPARLMLQYTSDPVARARIVSERTNGSFQSRYRTRIAILQPALLSVIAAEVARKVAIDGSTQANPTLYTPWLTDTVTAYQNSNFNTTAPLSNVGGYQYGGMKYGV